MSQLWEKELRQATDLYKEHQLELVEKTSKVEMYYLKKPGHGRMCSTLIIFSPEGIVIAGDLCPAGSGVISCLGYGLDWFARQLGPGYLAEKFLKQGWDQQAAGEDLRGRAEELREEGDMYFTDPEILAEAIQTTEDCASGCEAGNYTCEYEMWEELTYRAAVADYFESEVPGWGYSPREMALLSAIQQKFAELYNARLEKQADIKILLI